MNLIGPLILEVLGAAQNLWSWFSYRIRKTSCVDVHDEL